MPAPRLLPDRAPLLRRAAPLAPNFPAPACGTEFRHGRTSDRSSNPTQSHRTGRRPHSLLATCRRPAEIRLFALPVSFVADQQRSLRRASCTNDRTPPVPALPPTHRTTEPPPRPPRIVPPCSRSIPPST